MNNLNSLLMGLLQGVTEFLPVSSSGHLVLGKYFLDIHTPGAVLEVVLHLGTLGSILVYYRRELVELLKNSLGDPEGKPRKYLLAIVLSMIPAGLVGVFFEDGIDNLFHDPHLVAVALMVTGGVLLSTRFIRPGAPRTITLGTAMIIGIAQSIAIIPGISRSGMTIATGLLLGLSSEEAAKFSFIMSIPVLAGAGMLKFGEALTLASDSNRVVLAIGFLAAFLAGWVAISLLVKLVVQHRLWAFALYCIPLGMITFFLV